MPLLAPRGTTGPVEGGPDPTFVDLPWYRRWLYQQIRSQLQHLLLALPNMKCDEGSDWETHFVPLWNKVRERALVPEPKTINDMTDTLVEHGIVPAKDSYEAYQSAQELILSILGWQTTLYKPDLLSVWPEDSTFSTRWTDTTGKRGYALTSLLSRANMTYPVSSWVRHDAPATKLLRI
ncbi:hypothetical protein DL768_007523 [Monosporascus sp. mg162]|nr:hypothetical protein DL768_007523 [Monosporascus sp. mg162]